MSRVFDAPLYINDQSIDRVLAAGLPVALIFVNGQAPADLAKTINRLAHDHAGQLLIAQIDQSENAATARRYTIATTPAVVTVKGEQTVSRASAITGAELEQHVAYLLGNGPKPAERAATEAAHSATVGAAPSMPITVTTATFDQEVLRSSLPVVVDFWAPWCGPCRMVEPALKSLASAQQGRLRVAKINVDEQPALANRYGVQGIPTMIIFRNGQIADRWSGALPEPALKSRVQQVLNL